jgi:hypothetical protein
MQRSSMYAIIGGMRLAQPRSALVNHVQNNKKFVMMTLAQSAAGTWMLRGILHCQSSDHDTQFLGVADIVLLLGAVVKSNQVTRVNFAQRQP